MWTTQVVRFGLHLVLILVFLEWGPFVSRPRKARTGRKISCQPTNSNRSKGAATSGPSNVETWEEDSSSVVRRKKTWRNHEKGAASPGPRPPLRDN